MTFLDSVKTCLKKYGDFSGRATRSEFWYFYLAFILINIGSELARDTSNAIFAMLGIILLFAALLPLLAAGVRRMHDVDKSGWFILVPFYSFYLSVISGTPGDNRFGPPPAN